MTLHQLTGTPDDWRVRAAQAACAGARRRLAVDLPTHAGDADGAASTRSAPSSAHSSPEIVGPAGQGTAQPARGGGLRHARAGPRRGAATPRRSSCSSSKRSSAPPRCTSRTSASGGWALPNLIVHGTERAARTLDHADAAGRDRLVPAVQRARRGLRPRVARPRGDAGRGRLAAQRPEGLDVDGQGSRLGHLPGPHQPRGRQARRHLVLHGRHEDPRDRHPPAPRAHRHGDVQRGLLRRRVRPRGLPRRPGARRLARGRAPRWPTSGSTWARATRSAAGSSAC